MTREKTYVVYCHISPDGKRYVGITCQKLGKRFGLSGSRYARNPHLASAINKYGWDSFTHEVLADGLTFVEAAGKEKELIALYKTTDREYGYNHTLGGEGRAGDRMPGHVKEMLRRINTGSHISEAHKEAIRRANTGKQVSSETREKIRAANIGKQLSPETRAKIGESSRGNSYSAVKVRCIERGEVYNSVSEAARETGVIATNISRCFRTGGTAGGYHWERTGKRRQNT